MKTKTNIKAGGGLVGGLRVKSQVTAGGTTLNHNETLVCES